eukprot:2356963-Pleurochrysis_carterae.AAC.1
MGTTIFLFVGRVALAGARVVAVRESAGAAAFPTAGVASLSSADGVRGGGGAICSPVALAGLNNVILAVEAEGISFGRPDSGVSAMSCARSSTSLGTRFSAERVSRLSTTPAFRLCSASFLPPCSVVVFLRSVSHAFRHCSARSSRQSP